MRLIFMGSPDFSVPILQALIDAGHDVVAVYSQPPRPSGRGHKETPCPVHAAAAALGLPVFTPARLKDPADQAAFAALKADVAVVAAYGLILPKAILDAPKWGCINVHASLLPRWRGAAPIQRAIEAGDGVSGVTIMQMDVGLDTGDMLLVEQVPIGPTETGQSLHDSLSALGARLIVEALAKLQAGTLVATPQPQDGVTYAAKLDNKSGQLDWSRPAAVLANQIRAFNPWPSAWFTHNDTRIKVWDATAEAGSPRQAPGTVLDDRPAIATGDGVLVLKSLQRPGKGATPADAFLRGYPMAPGSKLD